MIFLTVPLGGLVFLPGFAGSTSLSTGRSDFGLNLLLVWALHGREMGAFPKAALLEWFLLLRCMPLGVDTWSHFLVFLTQLYADNLECTSYDVDSVFAAAQYTVSSYVHAVGQEASPSKCELLSTSLAARRRMTACMA